MRTEGSQGEAGHCDDILAIGSVEEKEKQSLGFPLAEPKWSDILKNLVYIAVVIGIAYFVTVRIGFDNIRVTVATAGIYAPLIIIVLKATTIVVVPLGGMPLYPIAGALFGFWKALGMTLIGDALGSAIAFYISRFFGRSVLRFFMSRQHLPIVERLIERCSDYKTFFKARLFFTGFPELFAYAAGFTKVPFWFFLPVHIGIHAIGAGLLVAFGDVIVSGNKLAIISVGLVTSLLAFAGVWWFHSDLKKAS